MKLALVISNLSFITKNPILFSVVDKVLDRIEMLRKQIKNQIRTKYETNKNTT